MGNVPVVIQGKVETPTGFIELRSQDWLNWLAENTSFRYEPQEYPGFTARVEKSDYWYGYRKISGKLHKRYIGKAEELTTERLEQIAALLEQPSQPRPRPEKVTENQLSVTHKEDYVTREDFEQLRSELEQLRSELKNPATEITTATATGTKVQNGSFQEEDESTVANNEEIQQLHTQVTDLETRLKLARQQKKELEIELARVERENRDFYNSERVQRMVRHIEQAEEEVKSLKQANQELHARLDNQHHLSPPTLPDLEDLESIRDRVLGNWRIKKGAESKDRIKQALDKFIESYSISYIKVT